MKESYIVFAREVLPKRYESSAFQELYKISFEANDLRESPVLDPTAFRNEFTKNYTDILNSSSKLNFEKQKALFGDVRSFIIKVLIEMKERLPLEHEIFKETQVIFFEEWNFDSWKWLAQKFNNVIENEESVHFQNEIKRMSIHFQNLKKQYNNSSRTTLETWESLSTLYPYMSKLAKATLVLPHSTVPVERIFSQMQDFKTEKRNRLSTENLEISLLIYQAFQESDLIIDSIMLNKYHKIWSKSEEKQNDNPDIDPIPIEEFINTQSKNKEKKYIVFEVPDSSEDELPDQKQIKYVKSQVFNESSYFPRSQS